MESALPPVRVGQRDIGRPNPTFVIAEIGINHEGDPGACEDLIEAAAESGADAVKLQSIDPEENYAPGTASYQVFSEGHLSNDDTARMFDVARALGIEVFTTAGDVRALRFVERLWPAAHKISSGLLTHLPLIAEAAATGRPLIISTGMAEMAEIAEAVETAERAGAGGIVLLQCTSLYPAPPATLGLRTIRSLEETFGVPVGFSDHSMGTEAAPLAVAAGACALEKHFTLDSGRDGFDHAISLEPEQFASMLAAIRAAEAMLGSGVKTPTPEERELAGKLRRKIVARTDLTTGSTLTLDTVAFMRLPEDQDGLSASDWNRLEGRRVARDVRRLEPLSTDDVVPDG